MKFKVPEAGHKWLLTVTSIETVNTDHGTRVAIVVSDGHPGYLPGPAVGWTAELAKAE